MFVCSRCHAFRIPTAVRCRICGERQSRLRTFLLHLLCFVVIVGLGALSCNGCSTRAGRPAAGFACGSRVSRTSLDIAARARAQYRATMLPGPPKENGYYS
jgi:hypothetical protein